MSSAYTKLKCPNCYVWNWFYIGDNVMDLDCSKADESSILECFRCHHRFFDPDLLHHFSKTEIYENQDWNLWDEVGHNEEEFLKQVETNDGLESPE
jgi:hypothetical protein